MGWLVLTHGVGPMRTYNIGALLLDLEDPTQVIGRLREPLLSPTPDEQDGYVPNVVYSCGALVHNGGLIIPYGMGDSAIGVATVVSGRGPRCPESQPRLTKMPHQMIGECDARQIPSEAVGKEAREIPQGKERSEEGEAGTAGQEG